MGYCSNVILRERLNDYEYCEKQIATMNYDQAFKNYNNIHYKVAK